MLRQCLDRAAGRPVKPAAAARHNTAQPRAALSDPPTADGCVSPRGLRNRVPTVSAGPRADDVRDDCCSVADAGEYLGGIGAQGIRPQWCGDRFLPALDFVVNGNVAMCRTIEYCRCWGILSEFGMLFYCRHSFLKSNA